MNLLYCNSNKVLVIGKHLSKAKWPMKQVTSPELCFKMLIIHVTYGT